MEATKLAYTKNFRSQPVDKPIAALQGTTGIIHFNYLMHYKKWLNAITALYYTEWMQESKCKSEFIDKLAVPGHALLWPFPVTDWMI
jgi:hypothetical protein